MVWFSYDRVTPLAIQASYGVKYRECSVVRLMSTRASSNIASLVTKDRTLFWRRFCAELMKPTSRHLFDASETHPCVVAAVLIVEGGRRRRPRGRRRAPQRVFKIHCLPLSLSPWLGDGLGRLQVVVDHFAACKRANKSKLVS